MRSTNRLLLILSLLFSLVAQPAHAQATIIYVNDDATGSNSGTSWANAYTNLQSALTAASSGQEIWVAAGSYRPAGPNGDRSASFVLKNGVAIYGGFVGTEIARSQRDWTANVVTLSGDLNRNDGANFASNGENSYRVVIGITGATLDGVSITGGNANGPGCPGTGCGGGIANSNSSPTLTNLVIHGNTTSFAGGGIYNDSLSSPTLTNITISKNRANNGAGIFNGASSSPTLINVSLSGNQANNSGGGMFNFFSSNPTLINVILSGNQSNDGGGMSNTNSNPILTNVTINSNQANNGGGISNTNSSPQLRNTIIWGNTATTHPNIRNVSGTSSFSSSLVQGSGGSSSWNSGFGSDNGNNLDVDPLFANSSNGDYRLRPGSPALDTGTTSNAPSIDMRSIPRPQGTGIDIGAIEMRSFALTISSGNKQNTLIGTAFAQPLAISLGETGGNPLPDIPVSFSGPSTGPSAILGSTTVSTTLSGTASVTATANLVVGSYSITATATGVPPASFSLNNVAQTQTISFAQPTNATYGEPPIALDANATSGLPVSLSSSTPSMCRISGSSAVILGAGTCTLVAEQAGNTLYAAAPPITRTITIIPKALAISANDTIRSIGQPNPSFSVRYTGLVNGETSSVLSGTLSLSTTATAASPPGSYPITPSGLTSSNYAIVFVPGSLTVTAAPPSQRRVFVPLVQQ